MSILIVDEQIIQNLKEKNSKYLQEIFREVEVVLNRFETQKKETERRRAFEEELININFQQDEIIEYLLKKLRYQQNTIKNLFNELRTFQSHSIQSLHKKEKEHELKLDEFRLELNASKMKLHEHSDTISKLERIRETLKRTEDPRKKTTKMKHQMKKLFTFEETLKELDSPSQSTGRASRPKTPVKFPKLQDGKGVSNLTPQKTREYFAQRSLCSVGVQCDLMKKKKRKRRDEAVQFVKGDDMVLGEEDEDQKRSFLSSAGDIQTRYKFWKDKNTKDNLDKALTDEKENIKDDFLDNFYTDSSDDEDGGDNTNKNVLKKYVKIVP